jgi:flagellar basal-body rod protein FlgC
MSLFNVFKLSSQGMSAQRARLESATANLANANTTRTPAGGPYRRRDTVFETISTHDGEEGFSSIFNDSWSNGGSEGVRAYTLLADATEVIERYQPGHPDADANGIVTLPEVDALEETVNILSAARSFEANATAFNTAKELARASLKLGEG